jgi:hypothetical protein
VLNGWLTESGDRSPETKAVTGHALQKVGSFSFCDLAFARYDSNNQKLCWEKK